MTPQDYKLSIDALLLCAEIIRSGDVVCYFSENDSGYEYAFSDFAARRLGVWTVGKSGLNISCDYSQYDTQEIKQMSREFDYLNVLLNERLEYVRLKQELL